MFSQTFPPPLAGLCTHAEGARAGLSVDATVARLRRYVYLKSQSLRLFAAQFNGLPEWETKSAISLHLWQDAEHSTWFRNRITEMRTPPHHLDQVPDPALGRLLPSSGRRGTRASSSRVSTGVLKPALAAAFREHLAQAHPIADQPTRRLLQFALAEEESQLAWGQGALAALAIDAAGAPARAAWQDHLSRYLAAAGGIHGESERPSEASLPAPRVGLPPATVLRPERDARFPRVWRSRGVVPSPTRPVHERLWWMMNVRLNEMHVSELIATVIADWSGQPWSSITISPGISGMKRATACSARWPSLRRALTTPRSRRTSALPNTRIASCRRRNAMRSCGIEQGLMTKAGKQAEVALARAGGDERATVFQDFDWADEVLHAAIGRRWLEPHFRSARSDAGRLTKKSGRPTTA
jgi:hypothetical protein